MKWLFSLQLIVILVIGVQNNESLKNETKKYSRKDGPYFPLDPLKKSVISLNKTYIDKDGNWTGPYFPLEPSKNHISNLLNTTYLDTNGNWTGPYFPSEPSKETITTTSTKSINYINKNGNWIGPYFPAEPQNETWNGSRQDNVDENKIVDSWNWFPHNPLKSQEDHQTHPNRYDAQLNEKHNEPIDNENVIMDGLHIEKKKNLECDNAKDNLAVDFDPFDTASKIHYTCLEKPYDPDTNIQPLITILQTPTRFVTKERCMDIKLNYNDKIPIHRDHRPLGLAFGEYLYAPAQRWLNNIERGAIVMLYHPCTNKQEIFKLKNLLANCLYRHIITPYTKLDKDRPLALASWTATLEMSVFDKNLVKNFIIEYAKNSPKSSFENGPYNHLLIKKSSLVSDETDSDLCPNVRYKSFPRLNMILLLI